MSIIEQAQYEVTDIQETLAIAVQDGRWRDVAKYASQLAEASELLTRLQWQAEKPWWVKS